MRTSSISAGDTCRPDTFSVSFDLSSKLSHHIINIRFDVNGEGRTRDVQEISSFVDFESIACSEPSIFQKRRPCSMLIIPISHRDHRSFNPQLPRLINRSIIPILLDNPSLKTR